MGTYATTHRSRQAEESSVPSAGLSPSRAPSFRLRRLFRSPAALLRTPNDERSTTNLSHGHTRKHWKSPTYISWTQMKQRVCNPNATGYEKYGGRGIKIDPRWQESFEAFLADMGVRPEGTSLDRIDGDGDYEPGNCRWATLSEQNLNRRGWTLAA